MWKKNQFQFEYIEVYLCKHLFYTPIIIIHLN